MIKFKLESLWKENREDWADYKEMNFVLFGISGSTFPAFGEVKEATYKRVYRLEILFLNFALLITFG